MRRQIAPYPTRIALDYSKIYGSDLESGPYFVCMGESDIEMLVKLLGYARRRVQWAYNLTDSASYYQGLTDDEWQTLTDHLDDLEGRLMAVVCQQDIIDAITALSACVCEATALAQRDVKRLPDLTPWIDEGTVTAKTEDQTYRNPTPPSTAEERCEYAQAVYYQVYEAYTEYLFPFADQASDVLLAALVASAGFTALVAFAGLPISLVGAIIGYVVDLAIDSSIENFVNWLQANKDELICEMYLGLPDFAASAENVRAYVDAATEISFLDKKLLNVMLGGEWWQRAVIEDQQVNGTWDDYLVPGQCDDCDPVDPDCEDYYGSGPDRWGHTYDPWYEENLPTCYAGQVVWDTTGTLTPTATTNNRYEFSLTQAGTPVSATFTMKLRYDAPPIGSFTIRTDTLAPGETKVFTGTFSTSYPGQPHWPQWTSSPQRTRLNYFCIRPPE